MTEGTPFVAKVGGQGKVTIPKNVRDLHVRGILARTAANQERVTRSPPDEGLPLPQILLDRHHLNGEWFEREDRRQEREARMDETGAGGWLPDRMKWLEGGHG